MARVRLGGKSFTAGPPHAPPCARTLLSRQWLGPPAWGGMPLAPPSRKAATQRRKAKEPTMLWTIVAILFVLWLLGLIGNIGGGLIHLLLVLAVIVIVVNLITGRRTIV
jgi:hypothetical protein